MNEDMKNEIAKSAQYIGMSVEEAEAKFVEVCEQNGIEPTNPIAKGIWRNYVANARRSQETTETKDSGESWYKAAFGFFVSLDAPRDSMAWNRMKAQEEYLRNEDNALEKGIVAVAVENALGKYTVSRYHNGEYREKVMPELPEGAVTLEDGRTYIPLDSTESYLSGEKNANYGRPLPAQLMRRSGVFFGSIGVNSEMKPYYFSYKGQAGVDFAPNTFEWVHFLCVANDAGTDIYGAKDLTVNSLSLNNEMNPDSDLYRDMTNFSFEDCLKEHFKSNLIPLVDMDKEHIVRQSLPVKERFIVTDGTVCNMNMTPTSNGNRIINLTDLDAELDYESDSGTTTCWIPEHLELDFVIGSTVIVVGRTSQSINDEGTQPATLNVSGLYCTEKHGSAVEVSQPVESNFDWF